MGMENYDPKEFLLFALQHFKLDVLNDEGNIIFIEKDYKIEIEGQKLFKLIHSGSVVAPFDDVEELCNFIKRDIELNEEN